MKLRHIRNRNKRSIVWQYTYRIGNGDPVTRRLSTRDVSSIGLVRMETPLPNGEALTISGEFHRVSTSRS